MQRDAANAPSGVNASSLVEKSRGHDVLAALAALFIYALCVLPFLTAIAFHITDRLIAVRNTDPRLWIWFYRWWPYALLHGLNPLHSHVVWAPKGVNLTWATSTPTIALALAPITLLWGPFVTYNIAALAGPVLAAWCAYLLCRETTGQFWPSLIGGWIFGFSPFEMAQLTSWPNLFTTWPIPALVLVALWRARGRLSTNIFILITVLLLTILFGISVEVFASTVIFSVLTLLVATWAVHLDRKVSIIRLMKESLAAIALCSLVVAPYLWFMLKDPTRPQGSLFSPHLSSTDLANLILPTPITWFGGPRFESISEWFAGFLWQQGAYFGLPLLIMIGLYWREFRTTAAGKIILFGGGVALLFSMGPYLQLFNKSLLIPMPWALWSHLPLLNNIVPERLIVYSFLAVAVMTARWLSFSQFRQSVRLGLAGLTVLFLVPNYAGGYWATKPENPPFFSSGIYKHYLQRGENVIILPSSLYGHATFWQGETNFYFNLTGGWLGQALAVHPYSNMTIPTDFHRKWGGPDYPQQLAAFISRHDIEAIIVDQQQASTCAALLKPLHIQPTRIGGIILYRFDPKRLIVKDHAIELLSGGK